MTFLIMSLERRAADDILDVGALGLFDGLQHAHGHVVILAPHDVDLLVLGQEVLHHLEGVVAAPVAELAVEHLDLGARNALVEPVLALLVDRDRQAADDHDFRIRRILLDVLAGDFASAGLLPAT